MLIPLALVVLALLVFWNTKRKTYTRTPFPPGPKPFPIIGNIFDLTTTELWLTASRWIPKYGSVTHVRVFSQSLVFLNTPDAAFDLLDKRGAIYSDKPHLVMLNELCGCENMVAFTPYGDRARRQRKLMQKAFGSGVISRYHGLMKMESKPFLKRLVANPARFDKHLRRSVSFKYPVNTFSYILSRYAGSLTLLVVYGHQVKYSDDPFLRLADECIDILANRICSGGGIWLVDVFPARESPSFYHTHSNPTFSSKLNAFPSGSPVLPSSVTLRYGKPKWKSSSTARMNLSRMKSFASNFPVFCRLITEAPFYRTKAQHAHPSSLRSLNQLIYPRHRSPQRTPTPPTPLQR